MEGPPRFIIGHHDARRRIPVTVETVQDAHAANYDMLTSPITTPHFHSRVLALLSTSLSHHSTTSEEDITRTKNASPVTIPPLTPADTPLTPDETISQIIGVASSWIDLCSPDPIIADISRQVLQLELAYAAFCGVTYVLIPGPRLCGQGVSETGVVQYGRVILDALSQGPFMQLYLWLPMIDHSDDQANEMGDLAPFARQQFLDQEETDTKRLDVFGTWEAWDMIRSICKYPSRLCVALSVPKLLPPVSIQSRWYSEPVRFLTLDGQIFMKNAKGYPVLSRAHQAFITRFSRLRTAPWFLLCDVSSIPSRTPPTNDLVANTSPFPTPAEAATESYHPKDPTAHLSYMRNLQTKQPIPTALDRFGAGYQDYLQAPLQPLTVNLESITYEVFEKDPVKYDWYERAIARALHDWIEQAKPTSNPDGRVVVAVVGAGRGPLVTRALKASEDVGVEIDLWALEKNPNAFVLLQRHNETIWNNRVNLVKSDMRTWCGPIRAANMGGASRIYNTDPDDNDSSNAAGAEPSKTALTGNTSANATATVPNSKGTFTGSPTLDTTYLLATREATAAPTPYKIDILISELLGSFADNELSPECLDGVQHLLNPIHGISIPASYTAHLTPIAAPKLHADILHGMSGASPHAAETPYVVMFNAVDYLSTTTESEEGEGQAFHSENSPSSPSSQTQSRFSPSNPMMPAPYSKAHTRQQIQSPTATGAAPAAPGPPAPTPVIHTAWSFQHPNPSLPSSLAANSITSPTTPSPLSPSSALSPLGGASSLLAASSTPSISNAHNARCSTLTFAIPNRGTCHGLAGYFESVLYRGVELSTNPNTMAAKSDSMISWFPIYFPLKTPLSLPDASELRVTMWRRTDDRKVWYEWILDVYVALPVPTTPTATGRGTARKVRIGGTQLHSSEKEACLM